jgi:guanine deaminase
MESSLANLAKAQTVYKRCVKRTLSHGTTTASYYATIHVPATNLLADLCLSIGQRAFIGRCCMDSDMSPETYRDESPQQAIEATEATISHIASIDSSYSLISPILTPRFAPSCSSELMTSLGKLHEETSLPIQTHISENVGELALVKKLFPGIKNYASVYDKFGLLTKKTILAHAIHLSDEEIALIKSRKAKISHCPCSNSSITSGTCKVRQLLDNGIDIGLGTDMSGGYSPSILEALRQAVLVSRHVAMGGDDNTKLSIEEVLYLATRGGAKVVNLEDKIGDFGVGMEWDAQLIGFGTDLWDEEDVTAEPSQLDEGPVDMFGWESWSDRIAKWVYNGDDRNTLAVWVKGRLVHEIKK